MRKYVVPILITVALFFAVRPAQKVDAIGARIVPPSADLVAEATPIPTPKSKDSSLVATQQRQFESQLESAMAEIPTLHSADSAFPTDDDHVVQGFSRNEMIAAQILADVKMLVDAHPEFARAAQKTYSECAQRTELSASVRALCYYRAVALVIKVKNPHEIVALNVNGEVRSLAEHIKDSTL